MPFKKGDIVIRKPLPLRVVEDQSFNDVVVTPVDGEPSREWTDNTDSLIQIVDVCLSFDKHRLHRDMSDIERAFALAWAHQNDGTMGREILGFLIPKLTPRDKQVAATLVQWFGTNVGLSFLSQVIETSPELARYLQRAVSRHKEQE